MLKVKSKNKKGISIKNRNSRIQNKTHKVCTFARSYKPFKPH